MRARGEGRPDPPAPMAPTALWAALTVGLQLWAAGRAVPSQVGDARRLAPTHPGWRESPAGMPEAA